MKTHGKKIGVALGGGTIRGMTHIGVLETFIQHKIPIDILVGCSSGSIVAAAHACGKLSELKDMTLAMKKKDRRKMLDFCLAGEGIIQGNKLKSFFEYITADKSFEEISNPKLAFVAADVFTGGEVVLNEGSIAAALERTTAVPGLVPLKRHKGRIVIDGGAAMIVPAKIAYEMGADFVIGVDVSVKKTFLTRLLGDIRELLKDGKFGKWSGRLASVQNKIKDADEKKLVGRTREIMKKIKLLDDYENRNFNFIEMVLLGLRAASIDYKKGMFRDDECDLAIHPKVGHVKRLDITKTKELIREGRRATEEKIEKIKEMLK